MKLDGSAGDQLVLDAIPAPLAALLRMVPDVAKEGEGSAATRFYPSPCDPAEESLAEDWREFVTPGLRHLFASARETVAEDLALMKPLPEQGVALWRLPLPRAHIPAWLSCLNQARLAIAELIGYSEADQHRPPGASTPTEREMRIYQMDFYAFLQEWLLQSLSPGADNPAEPPSDE